MHEAARQRCDELWPVIVNDVFSHAAQAELDSATAVYWFERPFHRLLWLIPHIPQVVTLKSSVARTYNDSIDLEMSK